MLTREENEYLCRVGPGTPMGEADEWVANYEPVVLTASPGGRR